ncbi:ABC-2 type transporter-domain-containing protein [Chaetomium sp. MPI-SDFR-AT-0129]|nr:ABC-2 type transporter-domain-containing protein [Chaetomium sp. MPI-SDFR-AT-0129]
MWGHSPEEALRRSAQDVLPDSLHHRDESQTPLPNQTTAEGGLSESEVSGEITKQPATPEREGTWGEREVGGPVSQRAAMHDFEELTTKLTTTRSHAAASQKSAKGTGAGNFFRRITSRASAVSKRPDEEAVVGDDESEIEDSTTDTDEFPLEQFMRDGHLEKRTESGESAKKVAVVYKNLTVKGVATGASFVRTLPQAIAGTFGPDLYGIFCYFIPALRIGGGGNLRTLIHDFTGVVRHGEMMMVLGRPGSGCSTFLKVIANNRETYAAVEGDVSYSGIPAAEARKRYRGEVVYNAEDDQHLPTLTVGQTLRFSLLNKTRKNLRGDLNTIVDALLRMFSIKHTENTLVGNAYVRGVSGGERKRVSIAETLATKSTIVCWDNSTRGLDASTALDYAKSLRIMTDVSDRTTLTTLYQAGEGIYDLMDKVLVIDEGRMLYQGPAKEARQYFVDLGFYAPPRQTTADFLTSICDPGSRQFREGWEARTPKTAEELETAFRASPAYQRLLDDVKEFEQHLTTTGHADAKTFKESVQEQKSKRVLAGSNYTIPFWKQVLACSRRELWLIWGNPTELYSKYFTIISNGLIVGSLFYNSPASTDGSFLRGGAVFFAVIFLGWLQLAELMKAVSGRDIVARHREYAFYRPSAVTLARALVDLPVLIMQVIIFGILLFFMTGLDLHPGKFFIQLLFMYATTFCITAMYRMLAAMSPTMDDAVRFSGMALNLLAIFTGYVISKPVLLSQKIWFGWIAHINPLSYSFEAVLSNEFHARTMECAPSQLVPQGPGILPENQGCAIGGAHLGNTSVLGDDYLAVQFDYSRAHLWRNFGVVIAFAVLYLIVTALATELMSFTGGGGGALVFKRSKRTANKTKTAAPADEESGNISGGSSSTEVPSGASDSAFRSITGSERTFTWENVEYTVPTADGPKKLLNGVNGYAKPGVMVALMGASGAGKTTLLNTLSQRQTVGVVSGDMLVDGSALGNDFQRSTGFVEQMDLHEESATVREAIEFSALLRQNRDIPKQEKLDYVDKVIDLLELNEIQDAIISSLGVEHKKRLTIGVELAARPALLLFLDEPTSGLDAQSAMSIVRFLRKLCAAGQAIICTIHQPSSDLIQEFDKILALNPGGNTIYFGPVGPDGSAVVKYFADRGVHCPPGRNVAEFLLETAIKGGRRPNGKRINWSDEWRTSPENEAVIAEIQELKAERAKAASASAQTQTAAQSAAVHHEFAAPVWQQILLLSKRMFVRQWREPSYVYGRLFTAVVIGIFNGFTFWRLGNSVADLQNAMFTSFLIIMIPATVMNAVLPKFFGNFALWMAREHPSRIYGWVAFCTAEVVSEIPGSLLAGALYWILWYLPTGLPREGPSAGYVFLMTLLFFLFQSSWGQWICAWAPSFTVISNILPCFLVIFCLFNGVVVPYSQLNVFWKYWLYWLNPSSYWVSGVLSATLAGRAVHCAPGEGAYFNPPSGQTCADFARDFVRAAGRGYIMNPDDTSNCGYCPYKDGSEYIQVLGVSPDTKWRNFGIFLVFCVTNWMLVYFFIYTVRIKGMSFGFGPLFGLFDKVIAGVKGLFKSKKVDEKTAA